MRRAPKEESAKEVRLAPRPEPEQVLHRLEFRPAELELIRKTIVDTSVITAPETDIFIHVAQSLGLDPLKKEIYCIKIQGRLFFVAGIHGLQRRAAEQPDFKGISHGVVYAGEDFLMDPEGHVLKHASNPFKQGAPLGAWASVQRKGMLPFTVTVRFSEYTTGKDNWAYKSATMIDKVARSQALRMAYPALFENVYERAELDTLEKEVNAPPETKAPPPPPLKSVKKPKPEAEPEEAETTPVEEPPAPTEESQPPAPEDDLEPGSDADEDPAPSIVDEMKLSHLRGAAFQAAYYLKVRDGTSADTPEGKLARTTYTTCRGRK